MPPSPSKKRGAPPGNHNAQRHGYYANRRKVRAGLAPALNNTQVRAGLAPALSTLSTQATRDGDQPAHAVAIAPPPGDGAVPGKPAPIPSQEDLIANLYGRQQQLLLYLKDLNSDPNAADRRMAAENLYAQNVVRLSHMLRQVAPGERRITDALNTALDTLAKELGVQL